MENTSRGLSLHSRFLGGAAAFCAAVIDDGSTNVTRPSSERTRYRWHGEVPRSGWVWSRGCWVRVFMVDVSIRSRARAVVVGCWFSLSLLHK